LRHRAAPGLHGIEAVRHRTVPVVDGTETSSHRAVSVVDGAETWIDRAENHFAASSSRFTMPAIHFTTTVYV
jgi:hypothetical protein